jgi:hypothetical protein
MTTESKTFEEPVAPFPNIDRFIDVRNHLVFGRWSDSHAVTGNLSLSNHRSPASKEMSDSDDGTWDVQIPKTRPVTNPPEDTYKLTGSMVAYLNLKMENYQQASPSVREKIVGEISEHFKEEVEEISSKRLSKKKWEALRQVWTSTKACQSYVT